MVDVEGVLRISSPHTEKDGEEEKMCFPLADLETWIKYSIPLDFFLNGFYEANAKLL